jgi:hypothetical protein
MTDAARQALLERCLAACDRYRRRRIAAVVDSGRSLAAVPLGRGKKQTVTK